MAQSRSYKKVMNFVYGMGAAVVIVGALFKIQHISLDLGIFEISGGLMLTIGLLVEAGVFAVSAFDTPEDDFDWTKVGENVQRNAEQISKNIMKNAETIGNNIARNSKAVGDRMTAYLNRNL